MAPREDKHSRSNAPHLSFTMTIRHSPQGLTVHIMPTWHDGINKVLAARLEGWADRHRFRYEIDEFGSITLRAEKAMSVPAVNACLTSLQSLLGRIVTPAMQKGFQVQVTYRFIDLR